MAENVNMSLNHVLCFILSRDVPDSNFDRIPDTRYHRIVGDRIRPDTGYRIQKTLRIVREFDVNNAIINKL